MNLRDSWGMTALAWAVLRGDEVKAKALLQAGARVDICDWAGLSPLFQAIRGENPTCVNLIMEAGADVTLKTQYGSNVLHFAAHVPDGLPIIKRLIAAGVDIDEQDPWGGRPLLYAINMNNIRTVELLLDKGSNIDNVDADGDSAIYYAIISCSHNVLQLLLQRGGSCTTVNRNGNTILHFSALYADLKTIEILLTTNLHGIDAYARNNAGKIAMQLVYERKEKPEGFIEAFQALLFEIRNRNDSMSGDHQSGRVVEVEDDSGPEDAFADAVEEQVED